MLCKVFYMLTYHPLEFTGFNKRYSYGLDGPRIESRGGRDFSHLFRPALRPIQPPVQWLPGLSRGNKAAEA
jgi:hypothetical protein